MTLNLLLTPRPPERAPVVLADPGGATTEPVLVALSAQLEFKRLMFPLPDQTTFRHVAPPSLMRERHADLWHALSDDERNRTLVIAGPTAAYLAGVVEGASTLVAVPDPSLAKAVGQNAWRFVLGPFPELDDVAEDPESQGERDHWEDQIRIATSRFELRRASELEQLGAVVAARAGLGGKQAAQAGALAASAASPATRARRREKAADWVDELLFSLTEPAPEGAQRKARRRDADSPRHARRERKRERKRRR